jgi:hypothetical protein
MWRRGGARCVVFEERSGPLGHGTEMTASFGCMDRMLARLRCLCELSGNGRGR